MGYLDQAKALFASYLPDDAVKVQSCSETDVTSVEQRFSAKLPLAYRELLLWMGRGGEGAIWKGFDWAYEDLPTINGWARKLVKESNTKLRLSEDAFVFFWDAGAVFYFFRLRDGDDPPVYFFMESNLEATLRQGFSPEPPDDPVVRYLLDAHDRVDFFCLSPSFSEFIVSETKKYVRLRQERESRR